MASNHTLHVPTRSITFSVPVLDDSTGKPLDPIVYEHVTVTPNAAAWIPDRLVAEFTSKGFVVPYNETTHSYLPVPAKPVDAA